MRFMLVTIIVAVCVSAALSQMTFSDHWSKKSETFPRYKPKQSDSPASQQQLGHQQQEPQFCQEGKVAEVLAQLARLNDVQNMLTGYLNTCYQRRV